MSQSLRDDLILADTGEVVLRHGEQITLETIKACRLIEASDLHMPSSLAINLLESLHDLAAFDYCRRRTHHDR